MACTVTDYLEEAAGRLPDKTAFVDAERKLTFGELRREARGIAASLRRLGAGREPVALLMDRDSRAVAAMLGASYAGRAYVPLDIASPPMRQRKVLEALRPAAIVTSRRLRKRLDGFWDGEVLVAEELSGAEDVEDLPGYAPISEDPLCIIFTSGSTGEPKGVVIPHRAVIANMEQYIGEMGLSEDDAAGSIAPFHYVLSLYDIYGGLCAGCTVHFLPGAALTFPAAAMAYLLEQGITGIFWAPTALRFVADTGILGELAEKKLLPPLRRVCFAGGVMPARVLNLWRRAFPGAEFINLYGFTETAGAAAFYRVDREFGEEEDLPIGRAGQERETFLLREDGTPVMGTEEGEVCVRGACLALGYLGDAARTREVFTADPRCPAMPARICRTGDIARWGEDGNLRYVSRRDFLVKHLGRRVELGEIEAAALAAGLRSACCLHDGARDELLLCYEGEREEKELLAALRERLPSYMVPTRLENCPIPMNSHGKVDRRRLEERFCR